MKTKIALFLNQNTRRGEMNGSQKNSPQDTPSVLLRSSSFEKKEIRRIWHENAWWLSVVDVCESLTGSIDAGAYWRKLKQRLIKEGSEVVTFCHGLKLEAVDGKKYKTDCANIAGIFRIIQSILRN